MNKTKCIVYRMIQSLEKSCTESTNSDGLKEMETALD